MITAPGSTPLEVATLIELLDRGLGCLHVRKPQWTEERTAAWLAELPKAWYPRLTLHGHPELARAMGLGGIHLRGGEAPPAFAWSGRLSQSFHHFEEVLHYVGPSLDYGFISPLWPSISKPGHGPGWTTAALEDFLQQARPMPLYGLGGITPERLPQVARWGLDGVAVLGGIWQEKTVHLRLKRFEGYEQGIETLRP